MTERIFKRQWWVQDAIDDLTSDSFGVSAGLGSGKTHGATDWHHDRVLLNGESPFSAFVMPIYQKIHDAAIPTFKKLYDSLGYTETVHYKVLKAPFPKIYFPSSGQEIHFISASRPDKIVAVEYSHATTSESGDYQREALDLVQTRVRCPKAVALQVMNEGAPQGVEGNPFADKYDDKRSTDWKEIESRLYFNARENIKRYRLTTYDNPFLPPGYVERLLKVYRDRPAYVQAYVHGHFVPLVEGNCYSGYSTAYDIDDMTAVPFADIHLTWDFNANPLAWVALQKLNFEEYEYRVQRWIAQHESSGESNQLKTAVLEFALKYDPKIFAKTPIILSGDSTGHHASHKTPLSDYDQIKALLNELGFQVVIVDAIKSNPPEHISVEAVNEWFRKDKLYICKRCVNLRRSLIMTRYKDGQKKIDKPAGENWTHWSDALKYKAVVEQTEKTSLTSQNI